MTFSPPTLLDGRRWAGLRIGLLGGSFNPPHAGHLHASLTAMAALELDFVWWLVTPRNPLKDDAGLRPYDERVAACRTLVTHPGVLVSDLEQRLGLRRSYDTIAALRRLFPATQFAWLTGMDNALGFHRWYRWRDILSIVPTAHVARPPADTLIVAAPLRRLSGQAQRHIERPGRFSLHPHQTFWILHRPLNSLSSTALRAARPVDLRIAGEMVKMDL